MKYLATKLNQKEITELLTRLNIVPNSLCVMCIKDGESYVINNDEHNHKELISTLNFYEKEVSQNDWVNIQRENNWKIIGDSNLKPF